MLKWTVGTDKGKVVFKPGVVIPDKAEINLVIEPDQATEIARELMRAALRLRGKMNIDAYHPRSFVAHISSSKMRNGKITLREGDRSIPRGAI